MPDGVRNRGSLCRAPGCCNNSKKVSRYAFRVYQHLPLPSIAKENKDKQKSIPVFVEKALTPFSAFSLKYRANKAIIKC